MRGPRLLRPLRHRDFALLTAGNTISRLGNGFFAVALAWAVYDIRDSPSALSLVSLVWLLPTVLLLLPAGVVADRVNRRHVMIPADLVRAVALAAMGALSVAGRLELWGIAALIGFVGAADAFFGPAATALIPTLLPDDDLPSANALDGMLRPMTNLIVGPALGGLVVGSVGPGAAFLFDGATFVLSAAAIALIRDHPASAPAG